MISLLFTTITLNERKFTVLDPNVHDADATNKATCLKESIKVVQPDFRQFVKIVSFRGAIVRVSSI